MTRRLLLAMLAPGAALALWLALGGLLLRLTLDPAQRAGVAAATGPLVASHGALAVAWFLVAAALAAWGVFRLHEAHVAAPARLADATEVLVGDAAAPDLEPAGGAPTRALAGAINRLAGQRRVLQQEMAQLVAAASRDVAAQRDQLGALMAELDQSVVVCNADGRILLYNERARQLFRRLSRAPGMAAGAELIGLGRSIHGVIDRPLIAHAVETVERRGGSARFVTTTPAGHLLRVNMAPVRAAASRNAALEGYVLLLDDITDEHEAGSLRERQLIELTEGSRASLAGMQAALDMLDYPDLDAEGRARFNAVVRDEMAALGARLAAFAANPSQGPTSRWQLQEMLGADLLAAVQRRIEEDHGQTAEIDAPDPGLWLSVDSFALLEALADLAGRVGAAFGRPALRLRLARAGTRAHLDLAWSGGAEAAGTLGDWRGAPIEARGGRSSLSVGEVAERHGGEVWIERDRAGGPSCLRFLLPLAASGPVSAPALVGSRPEYYDFELFAGAGHGALDERSLAEIAYTVFDTETTGLDPAQGDEILQIGATRIVNGRLLPGECFDQLVDPGRSIPEASTRIHGIDPSMVRGKPAIAEVLPAFHAFASDTVLVGHNVAFDMRFLALKEDASGVRFDQPVLDTLLLASVVQPGDASHGLEALAARLGVAPAARHTALGDALTTAEVFLRLVPLLGQRGVLTLAQAQEASRSSQYARLRY